MCKKSRFIEINFTHFFTPGGDFSAISCHQLEIGRLLARMMWQNAAGRSRVYQKPLSGDGVRQVEESAAD